MKKIPENKTEFILDFPENYLPEELENEIKMGHYSFSNFDALKKWPDGIVATKVRFSKILSELVKDENDENRLVFIRLS